MADGEGGPSQPLLTLVGVAVHIIVLLSIFDIFFQSPVLSGVPTVPPPAGWPAEADRLVLIVADGLRADKCFGTKSGDGQWAAPYLRSVSLERGAWGLSHTRVPTESRPGHVALIAGLYEDVSAVTRGWQENPVEFDSVFNRSRRTWSWGSPDILPMFAKGASGSRVATEFYSSKEENFADSDPSRLDSWVFDKVEGFLDDARRNDTALTMLNQNGNVFFLHLLGLDTIGHSSKPWSREYVAAIQLVDTGVRRTVAMFDDFYNNDGRTAFLFTADHGMTDWGSHGASDREETETPLVAWGAGIRGPLSPDTDDPSTQSSAEWELGIVKRTDINQADVAPLIATLLGIVIPVNSVGVLPEELLAGGDSVRARALLINAKQLGAHFRRHWQMKETGALPLLFRPFSKFSPAVLEGVFEHVLELIDAGKPGEAITETKELIGGILEGIDYFRTYDRTALSASVILGFLGWMTYLGCWLGEGHVRRLTSVGQLPPARAVANCSLRGRRLLPNVVFAILACLVIVLTYVKRDPATYYLYHAFPVFTWFLVNGRWPIVAAALSLTRRIRWTSVAYFLILVAAIELLVLVFFVRGSLSFLVLALAMWPLTTRLRHSSRILCSSWIVPLLMLAVSPLLPPVGRDTNYLAVFFAGYLAVAAFSSCLMKLKVSIRDSTRTTKLIGAVQIVILALITMNVCYVNHCLKVKREVPLLSRGFSWMTLASTFIVPMFGSPAILHRLFHIGVSLMTSYVLFSTSYEAFYFFILQVLLAMWFLIELRLGGCNGSQIATFTFGPELDRPNRRFMSDDVRRAYLSLLLLVVSYFGLGNTANINSFSPSSVYCFVTVFSPFLMGSLLVCKILIPFLAVAVVLRAIQVAEKRSPGHLFWAILMLSDVMVMNCFYAVRDEGSWLEIGSSIGRFMVVSTSTIAFMLLYALATPLTDLVIPLSKRHAP